MEIDWFEDVNPENWNIDAIYADGEWLSDSEFYEVMEVISDE